MPKIVFHIFNWTFISFIQSILLFSLAAPSYAVLLASKFEPGLSSADFAFVSIELGLVLIEWFADQQQWGMFFEVLKGAETTLTGSSIHPRLPDSQETVPGICEASQGL